MVLGAGLGSRMGALTAVTPKPLLPLAGTPMIELIAARLAAAGVHEIFVNLHFGADLMAAYLDRMDVGVPVRYAVEERLSGPAGALRLFRDELSAYNAVLVSSGDVLVGDPLTDLVAAHTTHRDPLVFACAQVTGARRYGVLEISEDGLLTGAREKPDVPDDERHWVSAGVYCLATEVIDAVPAGATYDFARDLAPALIADGRPVRAHRLSGYWRDIGSPESLRAAEQDAAAGNIPWLSPTGLKTEV